MKLDKKTEDMLKMTAEKLGLDADELLKRESVAEIDEQKEIDTLSLINKCCSQCKNSREIVGAIYYISKGMDIASAFGLVAVANDVFTEYSKKEAVDKDSSVGVMLNA